MRIVGLNSVHISSHLDNDERLMVLGQYQIPLREKGVLYVSLCHHPPECWKDPGDIIKNKINERVCVQLYGHKHIQEISKINNSLVIGSGATHPSRFEENWKPRYNWLTMWVDCTRDERLLKVVIYPRILNETRDSFIADNISCNERGFAEYSLILDRWDSVQAKAAIREVSLDDSVIAKINSDQEDLIIKGVINPIRTLVYRFLELSYIKRSSILSKFDLINEEDEGINHVDLLDEILQKAQNKKCLDELWQEVDNSHNDGKYSYNPFLNIGIGV